MVSISNGKFRATDLWNDLVCSFKTGMPLSRHRKGLRTFDDSFTASEAVNWLHSYLRASPQFGDNMSRHHVVMLLRKFLKAGVFSEVSRAYKSRLLHSSSVDNLDKGSISMLMSTTSIGSRHEFEDNNRLYRFLHPQTSSSSIRVSSSSSSTLEVASPLSDDCENKLPLNQPSSLSSSSQDKLNMLTTSRRPTHVLHHFNSQASLSTSDSNLHNGGEAFVNERPSVLQIHHASGSIHMVQRSVSDSKMSNPPEPPPLPPPPPHQVYLTSAASLDHKLVSSDELRVWLDCLISRLKRVLQLHSLKQLEVKDDVLFGKLTASYIHHNCVHVSPNGLVTDIDRRDHLPHMVLSAMKSLACWPQNTARFDHSCLLPAATLSSKRIAPLAHAEAVDPGTLPYVGFERDVFRFVLNYFENLPEPIIPFDLYDAFVNVLVIVDNLWMGSVDRAFGKSTTSLPFSVDDSAIGCKQQQRSAPQDPWSSRHEPMRTLEDQFCLYISSSSSTKPPPLPPRRNRILKQQGSAGIRQTPLANLRRSTSLSGDHFHSDNEAFKSWKSDSPNLFERDSVLTESLQLFTLLLPPARRRNLHLLLRMLHKITHNPYLRHLEEHDKNEFSSGGGHDSAILDAFAACILRKRRNLANLSTTRTSRGHTHDVFANQLVAYLTEHYQDVMRVPASLHQEVQNRRFGSLSRSTTSTTSKSSSELGRPVYCSQVPLSRYESMRHTETRAALRQLFRQLLTSPDEEESQQTQAVLSVKERRRRLKQFKLAHEDIFLEEFPTVAAENALFQRLDEEQQRENMQHGLLDRTLQKLRGIRL